MLGTGLVVPARADSCRPEHFLEEAKHLWAAEQDRESLDGISALWGRVCLLPHPAKALPPPIMEAWQAEIQAAGASYRAVPSPQGEPDLLDSSSGRVRFDWPTDKETNEPLSNFDVLLMTATEPTLIDDQYPTTRAVADAWHRDTQGHVSYFYNNRRHGITTFDDERLLALLTGQTPAH